jgi:hypothetical protein
VFLVQLVCHKTITCSASAESFEGASAKQHPANFDELLSLNEKNMSQLVVFSFCWDMNFNKYANKVIVSQQILLDGM